MPGTRSILVIRSLDRFRHDRDNAAMIRAWTILVCLPAVFGCASRDARPTNFAVRQSSSTDRGALLDEAEAVLIDLGYAIAKRNTAEGVIVSEPQAIEGAGQHTLRADNPLRKIAEVRAAGADSNLKVYCKVIIQEQSEESYRLLAFERGGDDVPGHQTAIDRDAATTAEQNTVWRMLRRDRTAEREILDRLSPLNTNP